MRADHLPHRVLDDFGQLWVRHLVRLCGQPLRVLPIQRGEVRAADDVGADVVQVDAVSENVLDLLVARSDHELLVDLLDPVHLVDLVDQYNLSGQLDLEHQ